MLVIYFNPDYIEVVHYNHIIVTEKNTKTIFISTHLFPPIYLCYNRVEKNRGRSNTPVIHTESSNHKRDFQPWKT